MTYYLTLINGFKRWRQAIASSLGATDADKLIKTNSSGFIDNTLLPSTVTLRGTVDALLRSNAGTVEARNAGNTALAPIKASDLTATGTGYFTNTVGSFYQTPAGVAAQLFFTSGSSVRWSFAKSSTAESGASAGSDFTIARYDDAGAYVSTPFYITRSTGQTTIASLVVPGPSTFTGVPTFSNGTTSPGTYVSTSTVGLDVRVGSGSNGTIRFSATAGTLRWVLGKSSTAESGSNVGSDLFFNAYDDAGAYLFTPFQIARSTGVTTISSLTVAAASTFGGLSTFNNGAYSLGTYISASTVGFECRTAAGSSAGFQFTTGSTGSSRRWTVGKNASAESGGNVGSDFFINSYDDSNNFLATALGITRSTGLAVFSNSIVAGQYLVSRAIGAEGGQLVLGYASNTTATSQGNSTWNIDVTAANLFRIFRINASGGVLNVLNIAESTGGMSTLGLTFNADGTIQALGVGNGSIAPNACGTGSFNLQTSRSAADQVPPGNYSFVTGINNRAAGFGSVAFGANNNAASVYGISMGFGSKTKRYAEMALASGAINAIGDTQTSQMVISGTTTNNTPTVLTSGNYIIPLENDSTIYFEIKVVARRVDVDDESGCWRFEGAIDRNSSAASTALVGLGVTKTAVAKDQTLWDVSADVDTTNGGLRITVTGEAGKTIRWVAFIRLVEVVA